MSLTMIVEGRTLAVKPTRDGCLFSGDFRDPRGMTKAQCLTLAGWFQACGATDAVVYECGTCDCPTPHEGHVCLVCDCECCMDGKLCPHCHENAVLDAQERFVESGRTP